MALSSNITLWSNSDVFNLPLENDTDCRDFVEDYVAMHDSNIDIIVFIAYLLILFFNTFLIAIILLNDHLRKKASISGHIL